ncbi:FAD-dependent oxidoreductase [Elusimicrobiota bacterium]
MEKPFLTILGGGVTGCALGYFASQKKIPFCIYEEKDQLGGHCATFEYNDFLFDSGAHRLHNKYPDVTDEIKKLLGDDLKQIKTPSIIHYRNHNYKYPISLLDIFLKFDPFSLLYNLLTILYRKISSENPFKNLDVCAKYLYGDFISNRFLLNYSEKLWGLPCTELSCEIIESRLNGLNIGNFLKKLSLTSDIDGIFYYPQKGIGMITELLFEKFPYGTVHLNSKITKISHDFKKINSIQLNHSSMIPVEKVINTLPLNEFIFLFDPPPSKTVLSAAGNLQFRDIILVGLLLNKESVTKAATIYFPEKSVPFSRIYEPKNRSTFMSPKNRTSLIAEIPCNANESIDIEQLTQAAIKKLVNLGYMGADEVLDTFSCRLHNAYPILSITAKNDKREIIKFLNLFNNLKILGRAGTFTYNWIHSNIRSAKDFIDHVSYP